MAIISGYHVLFGVNAMFQSILDRPESELAALDWADITHAGDVIEEQALFQPFKAGETSGYTMEKRFIRPDGSITWMRIHSDAPSYERP